MVNDFWLKNKHTISIFQTQVRDLAMHIEAQPKKHNAYIKKNVYAEKYWLLTLPAPCILKSCIKINNINLKSLFPHFFLVPQKVL